MPTYRFRYIVGQSAPEGSVVARNDEEAGETIWIFLVQKDGVLVPDTIRVTTPQRSMPDPEWATRPCAA